MADKWPLANGNWSNAANWNGGTKPVAGDDVFADGRTVTIDENVNVASVRTTARSGGTAGGGFVLPPDITVTATVIGHINAHCLTRSAAGNPSYVIGNVQGSTTNGGFGSGVLNSSSGTVFITGDVFGGSGGADGTLNSNAGIINSSSGGFVVTGNVTAGGNGASGANIFGSGTFVLTGSVRSNGNFPAVSLGGSGTSTLNISINPASTHPAVGVGATHIATVNGTIQTFTDLVAVNVVSATATLRMNGNLIDGPNGCSPVAGARIWYGPGAHQRRSNTGGSFAGPLITFTSYANAGAPAVSNVRKDVVYGPANEFTGTCAVPPANSTAFGVPVDNTVGTAVITEAGLTTLLQQALSPNAAVAVERSIDDEKSITFSWPVSGATITGEKSVDNGAYSAVAGGISFLRTESGRHYYTLAYNAADRVNEESTIRYKMTDGTYTRYFNLRLVPPGITPQQIEDQLEDEFTAVQSSVSAVGLAVIDRPTLAQIEASTVLAKESNATNNKTEILTAVGNIEVDNAAIASAVRVELTDELEIINNIPESFEFIAEQIDDIQTVFYVSPTFSIVPNAVKERTLRPYYKDTSRIGPIGIYDANKDEVDLTPFDGDMYVVVEDSDTDEVLMRDDDPYYVTYNLYIDPSPESVGVLNAPLCWALRRISDNKFLAGGPWEVQNGAYGEAE